MRFRPILIAAHAVFAVACSSVSDPGYATGSLTVGNATNGWLDIEVDRRRQFNSLSMNAVSYVFSVPVGIRNVRLSYGGGLGGAIEIPLEVDRNVSLTMIAFPTYPAGVGPEIGAVVLPDTDAYTPGGKSKLRIVHLAKTTGDVVIWRRQPGSQASNAIVTPVGLGAATPYLEGSAGVWEVWLTAGDGQKLLSSGPIEIPSGERRTLALVDTQQGPRFVLLAL